MKALWHGACSTIISPPATGDWVNCHCGGAAARWTDPVTGKFEISERNGDTARIIGFHNTFLMLGQEPPKPSDDWVRQTKAILADTPDSYLFKRRESAIVIIYGGETGDTKRIPWGQYMSEQPDGGGG